MSDTGMEATPFDDDETSREQAPAPAYGRQEQPGVVLARHRELLGWSVEQVAEQLKIAPRQIVALEADNYAALPGLAVVRGFIRAYAKILKIDATPLVSMIEVETVAPKEPHHLPSDLSRKMAQSGIPVTSGQPGRVWLLAGGGVVLILALVAAAQYMGYIQPMDQWGKSKKAPADAVVTTSTSAAAPVAQAPNTTVTTLPTPAAATLTTSTAATATDSAAPAATTTVLPSVAAPGTTAATTTTAARTATTTTAALTTTTAAARTATTTPAAATSGASDIEFTVREDSWVQLKLADGTNVVSRLLKAGTTETASFDGPAVLVIGNVSGIDVKLRGEPLTIKSGKANTARINLK
jgi:cytoskeleton protein RodZ